MSVELIVRFDYGRVVPWVRRVEGAWRAIAGPDGLELRSPVRLHGRDHSSAATFTVRAICVKVSNFQPSVPSWFFTQKATR